MAEIRIENLHKAFGDFIAVKDSNFVVNDGEFLALLGPSGCGKTTTLRMIAGLELPTAGSIRLAGEDVTFNRARDRDIAFVFQLFALYPHMNVRRNIGFPLLAQGVPKAEIKARVEETAKLLQIDHILDKPVSGLAGGDRQRVALGRAIVRRPKCFLMDEPLGTLDAEFRDVMVRELRELHNRIKATTVYVTHDQLEAMAMADKIAIMNKGVVEQFGTPEEVYNRPATLFVADFIGSPSMNQIKFQGAFTAGQTEVNLAGTAIAVPEIYQHLASGPRVLGVRPEHVRFDAASPLRATVYETEYLGTTQIVVLQLLGSIVRARASADRQFTVGEDVGVTFETDRLSLFDGVTGKAVDTAMMRGEHNG
ncbi:MAG: ABC transporter ATP-binding protein [Phyllobacteriaceae bacterium]|nr:ABC transporter ATP-binding protein [Phyllobacteriaceae bacterium]